MAKVCVIERVHDKKITYCSVWGWMPSIDQAMIWAEPQMARQHMSQMVLPPGVIRVVELDRPVDEQKAAPGVATDYDPFGHGGV